MTQLEALRYIEDHPKKDPKVNELTAELVRRFCDCHCKAEIMIRGNEIVCPECGHALKVT